MVGEAQPSGPGIPIASLWRFHILPSFCSTGKISPGLEF